MKKNELMNGDIVVLSSGNVAVVIGAGEDAYLLYQYGGFEFLDECYDEDLYNEMDEDMVMQVFRPDGGFGFEGVDQEVPVWERDETWKCPAEKEREEQHRISAERNKSEFEAQMMDWAAKAAETRKGMISIITQAFYGNRTGSEIRPESVDRFVLGYLNEELPVYEPIDRTVIRLPGSDNAVLIYNKFAEERALERKEALLREDGYELKPLATIPEMNLEIYSRCIVCRMNEAGELESLQDEDFAIWDRYLAR